MLVTCRLSILAFGSVFKNKGVELSWLNGTVIAEAVKGIGDMMDDLTSFIDFFGGLMSSVLL